MPGDGVGGSCFARDLLSPDADVVGLRGVHAHRARQAEDLDEDAPRRIDRAPAATPGVVERRPRASAAHRLGVDHRSPASSAFEPTL